MKQRRFLLVGHAYVDVSTDPQLLTPKMRLGGVFHAVRAMWALGSKFDLAYMAPSYLVDACEQYARAFGVSHSSQVGLVNGAPNVLMIKHLKETGAQGYEDLLRDERTVTFDPASFGAICTSGPTDVLMFPNSSDLNLLLEAIRANFLELPRVHVDISEIFDLALIPDQLLTTIITSTSSEWVNSYGVGGTVERLRSIASRVVVKENRGGAVIVDAGVRASSPAFLRPIAHSVGVGDCFDCALLTKELDSTAPEALKYASLIAGEYAATTDVDVFRQSVKAVEALTESEFRNLRGVRLEFDQRRSVNIYVAGPDFSYTNRRVFDEVLESLRYHNFCARAPIREHGEATLDTDILTRESLAQRDIELLTECQLVVAVLTFNDPGTLVEIGIAFHMGIPVIIHDPNHIVTNLMLESCAKCVTHELGDLIDSVFSLVGEEA